MTEETDPDLAEIERLNEYLKRTATPTSFRYATILMEHMWKQSKLVPAEDLAIFGYPGNRGESVRIFEGVIQRAGEEVGLGKSAASVGYSLLNAMQAVTTLRRYTRYTPTLVLVSYKPTQEQFDEFRSNLGLLSRRITPNKYEEMRKQIDDLLERVQKLERFARDTSDQLVRLEDRRMLGGH